MESKKIIIISFILMAMLLSVSAISASDLNDMEILGDNEKSYSDFNRTIGEASSSVTLESNYKFNASTDAGYTDGINITKSIKINGNNHSIDAAGSSRVFYIRNGNVEINNLIIKNAAHNLGSAIRTASGLTLNNVTFINCSSQTSFGAVLCQNTVLNVNNCKFIDTCGNNGASLSGVRSSVNVVNSTFSSTSQNINKGHIYLSTSNLTLNDSVFENTLAKYGAAVFAQDGNIRISGCKFKNLQANKTGGAIGFKNIDSFSITGCEFDNVSSANNGGAVFIDGGDEKKRTLLVNIADSIFNNCSSGFGGAILQLEGKLNINRCNFTGNTAKYEGGAVYTSYTTTNIEESRFISNKAFDELSYGGACYFDFTNATLSKNTFNANNASLVSTIYAYDTNLTLNNNDFDNPSNITAIFAVYGKTTLKGNKNLNESQLSLNNTNYFYNFENTAEYLVLQNSTLDFDQIPSSFDLRDYGWVTPVKNQGFNGACWAFGNLAALESALLRYTGETYSLSVNNLQNTMLKYSKYGTSDISEGGPESIAIAYLIDWLGIFPEGYDEYDELGKISSLYITPEDIHILNAITIPERKNSTDNDLIKNALIKYGAVATSHHADFNTSSYFNASCGAQYYYGSERVDHRVCIVGWDDNYSRYNFLKTPEGDGAWIVKNSWGSSWADGGYFYVSYYDTSIGREVGEKSVCYLITNDSYSRIYQNEVGGDFIFFSKDDRYYSNVFTAEEDELIAAVGTLFNKTGQDYEFTISVNGIDVYSQKGTSSFGGYESIKLNRYIQISKGDEFKITFTGMTPWAQKLRIHTREGLSFSSSDGEKWDDLHDEDAVAVLKAYSIKDLNITRNLIKYYGDDTSFTAKVDAEDAVIFEINGVKRTVIADSNGIARLEINYNPGNYIITTTWNNISVISYIIVKSTINLNESSITRGYNSNYDFKVQLFNKNGTPLNNTPVDISVNGVKKSFTSDAAGYVTVKFTKLTSAQKITVTNPITREVKSAVINVVSRFSNVKGISMYYFDGSAFKVRIRGDDGNVVGKNQAVTIKTYNVKTDSNGYATLKIPKTVKPGTYKLTATYKGQTIKKTVKVKQNLKTSKKYTVKKSAKKLVIKAKLKNGKKPLKNKKLVLKIKGKKIVSKTNKKGIAKFSINKKIIKKLKVGKKYSIKISYFKNTVKSSLKVKR